jgi:hypothetical protein
MRFTAPFLVALWFLAYAEPSWVVVRFGLDRDRIIKEECVQRGVPLAERTCFGQCHLVKQLNDLEEKEQQGAPTGTTLKWEPEADQRNAVSLGEPAPNDLNGPYRHPSSMLLTGVDRSLEGVPRS